MTYHLVAKILDIFLLKSQAVVLRLLAPVLQLDDQIDLLLFLNALDTIQGLYVDDTDASQLDKVSCDLR